MSTISNGSITILEALNNIESGKYIMPAFQRQYVWSLEQIEKLWDSILSDYPISTFLLWHVDDKVVSADTFFCDFLKEVTFDSRRMADGVNFNVTTINVDKRDTAVLDGQQRLTSLYLSLFGTAYIRGRYQRKSSQEGSVARIYIELDKDKSVLDDENGLNAKRIDIRYSEKEGKATPSQFELRNILEDRFIDRKTRVDAINEACKFVSEKSKEYAKCLLNKLCEKIFEEKLVTFTELYDMNQDDALEMFIRFNSGGKALKKSEISMSILATYWSTSRTEFGNLLSGTFKEFGTDFIIRAALMIYGDVTKPNINKKIVDDLKNNWSEFKIAIKNLEKVITKDMEYDINRFNRAWNVLLPILYVIYNNPEYEKCIDAMRIYLIRAILFIYFRSGTTGKLQEMKRQINNYNYEITVEMLDNITSLMVTDGKIEDVLNAEKGSRVAGEILYFLSYQSIDVTINYDEDHLHPFDKFNNSHPFGVDKKDWIEWGNNRNRLPNLHLLEGRSNKSKNAMSLIEYYNSMNSMQQKEFMKKSFIPEDCSLELKDFGEFYVKRKKLLEEEIKKLIK